MKAEAVFIREDHDAKVYGIQREDGLWLHFYTAGSICPRWEGTRTEVRNSFAPTLASVNLDLPRNTWCWARDAEEAALIFLMRR